MCGQRFSLAKDTVAVFNTNMFWRCLNRSGKVNTNDGRTSKPSEYCYAKKCQTFYGNVKFHLTTLGIRQARNLCSY